MAKDKKEKKASSKVIDFSKVKEGGLFNKRRVKEGSYRAKITKVVETPAKGDGIDMWLFTFETEAGGTYPYYCKLQENQLWKVRNLLVAAGITVPKKKLNVDPERLVGKTVGIDLGDDEYEGKQQSVINGVFAASEVQEPDEEVQGDEEEKPKKDKKKKGKKNKDDDMESISTDDV